MSAHKNIAYFLIQMPVLINRNFFFLEKYDYLKVYVDSNLNTFKDNKIFRFNLFQFVFKYSFLKLRAKQKTFKECKSNNTNPNRIISQEVMMIQNLKNKNRKELFIRVSTSATREEKVQEVE